MSTGKPVFLTALGILNALGRGKSEVRENLFAGRRPGIVSRDDFLVDRKPVYVGVVGDPLPVLPERLSKYHSRNLQLTIAAAMEIEAEIDDAIARYGRNRIAVVMGTSTSGIAEGEAAVREAHENGRLPEDYDMRVQEIGCTSESLAQYLELGGPAFTVSTACSSGAQALAMGRRLIQTGLVDAVIAGGADSLCQLTVNGFQALSAQSEGICNPFSRNRDGTTLGEGAALFLMETREAEVALLGAGTTTDAYNMTAPEPEGLGVEAAIRLALDEAGLPPDAVTYIHLHGTGTPHNDIMESKVVRRVFREGTPCSSSKGQIGHTLGAAGAMGAAHCWLSASTDNTHRYLPPHLWDGAADPELLSDNLVNVGDKLGSTKDAMFLSNAVAFGGNNMALILGRP